MDLTNADIAWVKAYAAEVARTFGREFGAAAHQFKLVARSFCLPKTPRFFNDTSGKAAEFPSAGNSALQTEVLTIVRGVRSSIDKQLP